MLLYVINLADLASTLMGLSCGLAEINPIINVLLSIHPALFILVKIVPAYFLCTHMGKSARKSRVDMLVYIAIVALYGATVVSNINKIVLFTGEVIL